jgi:peroxiredoxin
VRREGPRRLLAAVLAGLLLLTLATGCERQATPAPTRTRGPAPTPTPCDKCGKDRSRPAPTPTRVTGTGIGQQAPELSLPDLQGQTVELSDYRGQVVLLNFWATWCGPCRLEVPGLVAVYERLKERGFTVVAVNLGEPREQVEAFAGSNAMSFPILLDQSASSQRLYPTRGIPTSLLLDREGVVRQVVVGAMNEGMIAELVEPLF